MLDAINKFREESHKLEMTQEEQLILDQSIFAYKKDFINKENTNVSYFSENELISNEFDPNLIDKRIPIKEIIHFLKNCIDESGINLTSPNSFGYIPAGNLYPAALADYIAAITNKFSSVYFASPGAVKLENTLIKWICNLIGYPKTSGGVLTSGGSIANLIAVTCARESSKLKSKNYAKAVVYLTNNTHHSIHKALKTIGLGEAHIRYIKLDNKFKMDPKSLKTEIERDLKDKLIPWLVVASAGSTDLGSIDPLENIASLSKKFNLWLNVDAAYGGFFILTENGKKLLSHIHLADSVTLDPHKSFFLPYGIGMIIVKDQQCLFNTFSSEASYMRDCERPNNCVSPADLSPELSRNFRSLRLWLPLKIFGIAPFKASLEEKLLLAKYFYNEIKKINRMEVLCEPELSIVAFRFISEKKVNEFNQKLIREIQSDGKIFMSSTLIKDKIYLRMACLSNKTHIENIDLSISLIFQKIEELIFKKSIKKAKT